MRPLGDDGVAEERSWMVTTEGIILSPWLKFSSAALTLGWAFTQTQMVWFLFCLFREADPCTSSPNFTVTNIAIVFLVISLNTGSLSFSKIYLSFTYAKRVSWMGLWMGIIATPVSFRSLMVTLISAIPPGTQCSFFFFLTVLGGWLGWSFEILFVSGGRPTSLWASLLELLLLHPIDFYKAVFSLSFFLRYFLIPCLISSLTHRFFSSILLSLHVIGFLFFLMFISVIDFLSLYYHALKRCFNFLSSQIYQGLFCEVVCSLY